MAQLIADRRDIDFVLHEQLNVESLSQEQRFNEFGKKTVDPEWGGQGMPKTVAMAANEYFYGACNSFMLYNLLTHGASKLVETFGTPEQKKLYQGGFRQGDGGFCLFPPLS